MASRGKEKQEKAWIDVLFLLLLNINILKEMVDKGIFMGSIECCSGVVERAYPATELNTGEMGGQ